MNIALDISHHAPEITVAQFQRAKARGVSRIVVALNDPDEAKRQIANATEAGLEVEAYAYLYFAKNIKNQIAADLAIVKGTAVRRIWLDAEDTSSGVTQASIIDGLRAAESLVTQAGYRTGIYTASWFWRGHTGNSDRFKHLPLWDAYWDKSPDIDPVTYGGWTKPAMSQHTPDTHFEGIWCDINSYEPDPLGDVPRFTGTDYANLTSLLFLGNKYPDGGQGSVTIKYEKSVSSGSQVTDTFTVTRARKV